MNRPQLVTNDVGSNLIRGLHDACAKQADPTPARSHLGLALRSASIAARDFAMSDEPIDKAQRERYSTLADTLEAQHRSLRAEVRTI